MYFEPFDKSTFKDFLREANTKPDYTTNAGSYYKELARKNQLIELLSKRIWDYDIELAKRFEEWAKNLEALPDDVMNLLKEWMDDGTFAEIINEEIFNGKASKESVTDIYLNVKSFGAKGDGITDDRQAIQDTIDYGISIGGAVIYFPIGRYLLGSTHPLYDCHLLVHGDNISFKGNNERNTRIIAGVNADTNILLFKETSEPKVFFYYFNLDDMTIEGDRKVNYNLKTGDKYVPYINMNRAFFNNAIEKSIEVKTYACTWQSVTTQGSKVGFSPIPMEGNIATSITFNSCYANSHTVAGYQSKNLVYSTFNSCAADNCDIAYYISGRGITYNACGAEGCRQIMKSDIAMGITINSMYSMSSGSVDPTKPTEFLFEFGTGENIVINGFYKQAMRHYKKVLGLTSKDWGNENITVLDDSIKRSESYFIPNFTFDRPIKFLRDDVTKKSISKTINIVDLKKELLNLDGMTINHNLTIKINNGEDLDNSIKYLQNIDGNGVITIEGNPNRELVKILGGYWLFRLKNVKPKIIFKNLTIVDRNETYNGFNHLIDTDNCSVIFDNVLFLSTITPFTGSAIYAKNSEITITPKTTAMGSFSGNDAQKVYEVDDGSILHLPKLSSIPTTGFWSKGSKIENKNPLTSIGWVCTESGTPGTWKEYGIIQ